MKLYSLDNKFINETLHVPHNFTGFVVWGNGTKEWFFNHKTHRVDGPAIERKDGAKYWFIDGKLHRLDGPAIDYKDGPKYWYIDGKEITELQCKCLHDIMKLKGLLV